MPRCRNLHFAGCGIFYCVIYVAAGADRARCCVFYAILFLIPAKG